MTGAADRVDPEVALGNPVPDRYRQGGWPRVLLERMGYWVEKSGASGHLLDLGCGEGALLSSLAVKGVGADLNFRRLVHARDKALAVCHADGLQLPFADDTFSTVVSMEVLEHVPDMKAMMAEVHRVLKPGGCWIISVPGVTLRSWYEMHKDQRPYYCDADEHYREFTPVPIRGLDHKFMSTDELETLCRKSGFNTLHRDGVRYLFPQWFGRLPVLQRVIESPGADRIWAKTPGIRRFPYWIIRVLQRG